MESHNLDLCVHRSFGRGARGEGLRNFCVSPKVCNGGASDD
jgi:hypothetical protein